LELLLGKDWNPQRIIPFEDKPIPIDVNIEPNKIFMYPDKANIEFAKTILKDIERKICLDASADNEYARVMEHIERSGDWDFFAEDYAREISMSKNKKVYQETGRDPGSDINLMLTLRAFALLRK
jgi:hypothetical protein